VEARATHFFRDDWGIIAAMNNVGLKEKGSINLWLLRVAGVWDGEELSTAPKCNVESPSWRDVVRLGLEITVFSPWRFSHAVLSNLEKWKSFASLRTFDSIVKELEDVGLDGLISVSAENYLRNLSVGPRFQSNLYSHVRELAFHRTWPMFVDSPL
jgi:hypothetical protein